VRTRELIYTLKAIQREPKTIGIFPGRKQILEHAAKEYKRLERLGDLLPEIIKKLDHPNA
jgi:hypothetical protein